jgi:hypothetical protein
MSGGHFDYEQFHITEIADTIEYEIKRNSEKDCGCFSEHTLSEFRVAVSLLRKAAIYTQRIDWLLSGDDAEDSFHRRLKEDIKEWIEEK